MKAFQTKETDIIRGIKIKIREYISKSKIIDMETKSALLEDIGFNDYDGRFDPEYFMQTALQYSVSVWQEQNFELLKLWKDVAVKNASISNSPYQAANQTVEEFKKQFIDIQL
jgi:hypothetical protein